MSFFNVKIVNEDESIFTSTLPEVHKFFVDNLMAKLPESHKQADYVFNQAIGFMSPKGQCYEVSYKKTDYDNYNRRTYTAYMECHLDKFGTFVLDQFDLG